VLCPHSAQTMSWRVNSHIHCCAPTVPRLCHGVLIHTNRTVSLPCLDIAMSFVKVCMVARKIWTVNPLRIAFMCMWFISKPWTWNVYTVFPPLIIISQVVVKVSKGMHAGLHVKCLLLSSISDFITIQEMLEFFYLHICLILITMTPTLSWKWFWRNYICSSKCHLAHWTPFCVVLFCSMSGALSMSICICQLYTLNFL